MANTKVTQHVIANNAITADQLASAAVTDAKLHSTLDLSSKTLTLPATAIPSASTATTQSASDNSTKLATTAYVTTALANLVDSSPSSLNTLNELAAALNDDASFSTTVTNSIATKLPLAGGTMTGAIAMNANAITSTSALTLDAATQVNIDADSGYIVLKDGGTQFGLLRGHSDHFMIKSLAQDKDMSFRGNDGGSEVVALSLDMSEAGFATFSDGAVFGGTGAIRIPQGTTGQRPSAATGQLRWNTSDGALEVYNGSAWTAVGTGSSNKILDTFTGDNSTTDFTLSVTPANEDALMVFIDGVYQEKGDYTLTNAVLALDTAPASGEKIAVHITTASVHDGTSAVNQQFTATAGQTAFTLSADPKSENNTQVYINGVYQQKTDYTVSGTTLTFDTGLTVGDVVEVNSFTVTTLGNTDTVTEGTTNLYHTTARARSAISVSGNALSYNSSTGVITSAYEESPTFTGTVTSAGLVVDTGTLAVDATNNRVGIGTSSPAGKLDVSVASNQRIRLDDFGGTSRISSRNDSATILALKIDASDLILNSGSGGDVGIGTSSPAGALHIKSDTNRTINTDFTLADGTGTYTWHAYQRNGADKWRVGGKADDSYLSWYNDSNSSHQLALASNGKVFVNIDPSNFGAYASLGDFIFKQSLDDLGIGIIDNNATNTFKFINNGTEAKIAYNAALPIKFYTSDTTKQFEIHNSGAIKSSQGGMVLQTKEEYNSTAAAVTGSATTVVIGMDITVKQGSKVAVWFHSGQILNTSTGTNPNGHLQWVTGSGAGQTITNITYQNHNHYWWDQSDNIDRNFISTQGMSGALSAGTYNIRFLGGTYNGTTTWNYQGQGSHLIVQEIAAN